MKGDCRHVGCWVGKLPKGCELCMKGLKSVVFVTGVCPDNCFYCPISYEKKGKDITYVNELRVRSGKDLILEVCACGSRGAGITGGDPIARLERTVSYISTLKDFFGNSFHIHLYTSGTLLTDEAMDKLVRAGLDEIRIHIIGKRSWEALRTALKYPISIGIENPAIPGAEDALKVIVAKAHNLGVDFINLNELEFSETNQYQLMLRGIKPTEGGVAALGSRETALSVLKWVKDKGLGINVHYCPASFKDNVQFRLRMLQRARITRRVYEDVTDDGLVRWVEVPADNPFAKELRLRGLAFTIGNITYMHPRVAAALKGSFKIVEAYPVDPRRVLNAWIEDRRLRPRSA